MIEQIEPRDYWTLVLLSWLPTPNESRHLGLRNPVSNDLPRLGAVVFFERLRHPAFQLLNAGAMRRMIGEELRRLCGIGLFHSLPKSDAFARIVSGARHINKSNVIGFRFVVATKRHEYAILRAGTERAHYCYLLLVIHVRKRAGDARYRGLSEVLLKNALRSMTRSGMRHLMTEHCCQRRVTVRNRKDPSVDNNLPARKTKRIHVIALHKRHAPIEIFSSSSCCSGQALDDALDSFQVRSRIDDLGLGEDLLVALQA